MASPEFLPNLKGTEMYAQAMLDRQAYQMLAKRMSQRRLTSHVRLFLETSDSAYQVIHEWRPYIECPLDLALDALEFAAKDVNMYLFDGGHHTEGAELCALYERRRRLPDVVRLTIEQYDLMNPDPAHRAGPSVLIS